VNAAFAANHSRFDLLPPMFLLGGYPKDIKNLSAVRLAFLDTNLALGGGMMRRVCQKNVPENVELMIENNLRHMCFRLIRTIM